MLDLKAYKMCSVPYSRTLNIIAAFKNPSVSGQPDHSEQIRLKQILGVILAT